MRVITPRRPNRLKPTLFVHCDGTSCMYATDRRRGTAQLARKILPRVEAAFDYVIMEYRRERHAGEVIYREVRRLTTSHCRGHPIRLTDLGWVYEDGTPMDEDRPCVRCNEPPTPEGHDACLGTIPGVTSACCGHGVTEPIRMEEP